MNKQERYELLYKIMQENYAISQDLQLTPQTRDEFFGKALDIERILALMSIAGKVGNG